MQNNSTTKDIAVMVVASLVKANVIPWEIAYNVIDGETLGVWLQLTQRSPVITLSIQWKPNNYADPAAEVPTFECAAWEGNRFKYINPYKNDRRSTGCDTVMTHVNLAIIAGWARRLINPPSMG